MLSVIFHPPQLRHGRRESLQPRVGFRAGVDGEKQRRPASEAHHVSSPLAISRVLSAIRAGWVRSLSLFGSLLLVQLAGCASIGPPSVNRDRFDYVVAISESVKRQTLLNLVKTRYMDMPVYMDIASVISQYALEGQLGFEFAPSFSDNNLLLGQGTYTDRPTITYSPLVGEKYSRSLLKPLPISSVFMLLQSGYPVDIMLRICVQTINGIDNQRSGAIAAREADPRFAQVLDLMRELQGMNRLYYRIDAAATGYDIKVVFRPPENQVAKERISQLKQLLGLDAKENAFPVVFGAVARGNAEIAVITRSMVQIMIEYAADIDVPQSDVDEGRVMPTRVVSTGNDAELLRLIRVHNGTAPPDDAYAAVPYRGRWYWVADNDLVSKASLQFVMMLFSLTERGTASNLAPVITVPTN